MKNLNELSQPFPPEDIEWFIGATTQDKSKGLAIPFITNRAVMERLDDVCGIDGWRNEYKVLGSREIIGKNGGVESKKTSQLCGISIWSEDKHEWITKWDGAEESDIEAIKGSLSSAMKRAAVQFGIGRYLYRLENPWVEIEQKGRSYTIKANQRIVMPAWAMPGGTGRPGINDSKTPTIEYIGYQQAPMQVQAPVQQPMQQQAPVTQAPSNGQTRYTLSPKQVARALKKGEMAGQSQESIIEWCQKKYNVDKIENLSRQQYDELCATLDRNRIY